jgi:hypothetical protein
VDVVHLLCHFCHSFLSPLDSLKRNFGSFLQSLDRVDLSNPKNILLRVLFNSLEPFMHVNRLITDLYRHILLQEFPLVCFEHADFVVETTSEPVVFIFSWNHLLIVIDQKLDLVLMLCFFTCHECKRSRKLRLHHALSKSRLHSSLHPRLHYCLTKKPSASAS